MKKLFILSFLILAFFACKKDTKLETYKVVINDEITSLSSTDASIVVKYTYVSKLNIKLLYGTNTNMFETAEAVENNNTYIFELDNLTPNTKYFYCFSYSNSLSSERSEIKDFNTPDDPPVYNVSVSIKAITDITTSSAKSGGNIQVTGDVQILSRGVCYSINQNPTINDNITSDGSGAGDFDSMLNNLSENTVYYVKAYARTADSIYYSNQISFTTENIIVNNYFSVSDSNKIVFSPGNLQYNPATNTWRFAENQYDIVGNDNQNISYTYNGWLDLFGWGTSGYNGCYPWLTVSDNAAYGDESNNITGTMYDWGLYIDINSTQGEWRTLTKDEWLYVINSRNNASMLRSRATILGVHGLILLPDDWVKPDGIDYVEDANNWSTNRYTASEWTILEASHAVFLPAAGNRNETTVNDVNNIGGYWSTNSSGNIGAFYLMFSESSNNSTLSGRFIGRSVRLVQDY